ncbi:DUF3231 family protein [Neobacillus niacini]|uniref:DUF3231 family protein n=1 Tax=Neobacillus niacini TaxID=86668 RepID=UPI0037C8F646
MGNCSDCHFELFAFGKMEGPSCICHHWWSSCRGNFFRLKQNSIGKALMIAFAQTTKDNEVKQFLERGKQIAQKHLAFFSDYLKIENLPAPKLN